MVAHQVGYDVLNQRPQLQVGQEIRCLGIGTGQSQHGTIVADEDLTQVVGWRFVAPTLAGQRTVLALVAKEAEVIAVAVL